MTEELKRAIDVLSKKIKEGTNPDEALKFTQAALNLSHTAITLVNVQIAENQL